ncbi:NAD(P)/FAD-dependent oxidoreductase [Dietzia sp. B32]|uniref:flavin-containing monooxygenase n=1 Tax=Dietzia sp. B32 TaxID=2915130 RepID=UPI0021ADEF57|nr:NAD(P)/FAD-dependent oxidoreductase [Dietzia sp. B32]UVE93832.1 NAD(P)/FAD-dependent oxidoreductase [Dietzia sp. B32]
MNSQFGSDNVDVDLVIVGAGFSGLYLTYRAKQLGFSVRVFEAGTSVGGTWYWNTYPGARCDVESIDYSFSFSEELQQEWNWSERYAAQPEILAYLNHVADRFDLRRHVTFNSRVTSAEFFDDGWLITTSTGETVRSTFCVMASGGLSAPKKPDFEGLDDFRGEWFHTARWPAEGVDVRGKRVGVIGTGSTGIQAIPQLAKNAEHVTVFQRTPNYSVPARNRPLSQDELNEVKATYSDRRARARRAPSGVPPVSAPEPGAPLSEEQRVSVLEAGWEFGGAPVLLRAFSDVMTDAGVNKTVGDFVRRKIAETVKDPATAKALAPTDYPFGAKRLCVDTDYYQTYNRDNVELVDLRGNPIERITADGVVCGGIEHKVDVLVFAIGFDAISGALTEIDLIGRDGRQLREYWRGGPKATLGVQVAGFPNLFLVNGPGSPAVLGNVVTFAEQHIEWITECLDYLRAHSISTIETTEELDDGWAAHVDEVGATTLYVKAKSWYTGENVPGKPRRFLPYAGGLDVFRDKCDEIANKGYEGFVLTPARAEATSTV